MARILLGVTGGIAAYKALELVRLATAAGHAVRTIQTPSSTRFVGAASFAALTGAPALCDEAERDPLRGAFPGQALPDHDPIGHLELVRNADVYVIAPASANTIAKLAAGLADNLLCNAALAATCPLLVAPAMNVNMWEHAATRANIATLRTRGVTVIEPGAGRLASHGEAGPGRLPEPADLLVVAEALMAGAAGAPPSQPHLVGLRVLVTAGGTREPIDAVRFLGNRSSGRMGWALAEEAARRGAEVTVVAANVALPRRPGLHYVEVGTAAELADACAQAFEHCDVLLMAAAVADYAPLEAHAGKVKKGEAGERLSLELARTPDVLSGLAARRRPGQLLVGFAAEHGEGAVAYAREKLQRKRLDAVVVNDVSMPGIAFEAPENEVTIVTEDGDQHVPRATKAEVARAVLDAVLSRRSSSSVRVGS